MMRESRGHVIHVSADGTAQVEVGRDDYAGGCTSPSEHCHCAEEGEGLALKAENRAGAKVGDYVAVVFRPGAVLKSLLVLIGLPSLGILTGLIVGGMLSEKAAVSPAHAFFVGAACFALTVLIAALLYRRIASQLKPSVDRIIASGEGARFFAGVDPVCGSALDPLNAAGKIAYEGRTYLFCGAGCLDAFVKEPHRYAGVSSCAQCGGN